MAKVYYDADADIADISEETVAVIGYGIQGRAQSLNMRDSGLSVIVGNRDDDYRKRADADGFKVYDIETAAKQGGVVVMLIPDEIQAQVYKEQIEGGLDDGNALVFAHGFAIRYGLIYFPARRSGLSPGCPTHAGRICAGFFPERWGRSRLC